MHIIFFISYILLASTIVGCATVNYPVEFPDCSGLGLQPLPYQMEPIKFETFSILPPQGNHWCIGFLGKKKGGLFYKNQFAGEKFYKVPRYEHQTLATSFIVFKDDIGIDKLESLKQHLEDDIKRSSATLVDFKLKEFPGHKGAICVAIEYTQVGFLSEKMPNKEFHFENHLLTCRHPERPLIITVSNSERYLANSSPPYSLIDKFKAELEPIFESLEFF